MLRIPLPDEKATRQLGAAVAELLEPGDVVLLIGELGAGKTTLTKGLVAALGGEVEVTSPTFTLMHHYQCTPPVVHVDCWRLDQLEELVELALDELLDSGGVAVIEWGELAVPLLGRDALMVELEHDEVPVSSGVPGFDAADPSGMDGSAAAIGRSALLATTGSRWQRRRGHLEGALRRDFPGLAVLDAPGGDGAR